MWHPLARPRRPKEPYRAVRQQPPTSSSGAEPSKPSTTNAPDGRGDRGPGRPDRRRRVGCDDRGHDRLLDPRRRARAAGPSCRASRMPTSTRPSRASTSCAATCASPTTGCRTRATRWLERPPGLCRRAPGRRLDRRERLVHGLVPARPAAPGRPRCRDRRPGGVPAEPRRSQRLGQQPGARARAGIGPATPDPVGGRIERDPDGSPSGVLHEAAMDLVQRVLPPDSQARLRGRAPPRPGQAARPRDHRLAGRDRPARPPRRLPRRGRARRAHRPGGRGALVGARLGRVGRRRARRAPSGRTARPVPGHLGQDHGRRRPRDVHRRDARAIPLARRRARPTEPGSCSSSPAGCGG